MNLPRGTDDGDYQCMDLSGIIQEQDTLSCKEFDLSLNMNSNEVCSIASFLPEKCDILCGRTKVAANHVGNKRYREIIAQHRERYQNATNRTEKFRITTQVIDVLLEEGGHFLKFDPITGTWNDVGSAYTYEKVSHALRSAKDSTKKRARRESDARACKTWTKTADDGLQTLLSEQQTIFKGLLLREDRVLGEPLDLSVDDISTAIPV